MDAVQKKMDEELDYGAIVIASPESVKRIKQVLEPGRIEALTYYPDRVILAALGNRQIVEKAAQEIAQKLGLPSRKVRAAPPIVIKNFHHSFYGKDFEAKIKELASRIHFQNPQIPMIHSSAPQISRLRTAEDVKVGIQTAMLGPIYWGQIPQLIEASTTKTLTISSDPNNLNRLENLKVEELDGDLVMNSELPEKSAGGAMNGSDDSKGSSKSEVIK